MSDRESKSKIPKPKDTIEIFESVRNFVDLVSFFLEKEIRKHGVTPSQFNLLRAIRNDKPDSQKKLGEMLVHTGGNVTVVTKLLVKKKLVKREKRPEDKRVYIVQLTEQGKKILSKAEEEYRAILNLLMSHMSAKEQETMGSISSGMFGKLSQERVKAIRSYRPPKKK